MIKMKAFARFALSFGFVVAASTLTNTFCLPSNAAESVSVSVYNGGQKLSFAKAPYIFNSRVYVTKEEFAKKFSKTIKWNSSTGRLEIVLNEVCISIPQNQKKLYTDDTSINMDTSIIKNGNNVSFPLAPVLKAAGYRVIWDKNTYSVKVYQQSQVPPVSRGSGKKYVVTIDAGHGGKETGAKYNGVLEKNLNLDIALRLKSKLVKKGINVIMTRSSDVTVGLYTRSGIANNSSSDMFVSVHNNASPNLKTTGTMTLFDPRYQNNKGVLSSQRLAQILQNKTVGRISSIDLGLIERTNLAILRTSRVPTALVEVGYMSNSGELNKLTDEYHRQKAANAIADAILEAVRYV